MVIVTANYVQELAQLPEPEFSRVMADPGTPHNKIIAKAWEVRSLYPGDTELQKRMDFLIGGCCLPLAKQHHGEAMQLEHPRC